MNPILAREIRARWRDNRSFLLLFGFSAALSLALWWIYREKTNDLVREMAEGVTFRGRSGNGAVLAQMDQLGRTLFQTLTIGQSLAWFVIAPGLTATSIAAERERGLLESIWLSQLRPSALMAGRLFSTLFFVFCLQIALVPLLAICLLLGGVSPLEIGMCLAIGAGTAFCGASIGLWCSARSHRPAGALSLACGFLVVWTLAAYATRDILWVLSYGLGFHVSPLARDSFAAVAQWLALIHPFLTATALAHQSRPNFLLGLSVEATCFVAIACQIALGAILLVNATRRASQPLPQNGWLGRNSRLETWRADWKTAAAARREAREKARLSHKVEGALLAELPIGALVRFKNPVLAREVRARFRLRRVGLLTTLLRVLALVTAMGFWLFVLFNALDLSSRRAAGETLILGLFFGASLAISVMAARSFSGEREAGTWEGLRLALLQPWEIVRAKWSSPLISTFYYSAPLWVLLPFCVAWLGPLEQGHGLSWQEMALCVGVVLSWASLVSAWGLWLSWRCRSTPAATIWTLATLFVAFVAFPYFVEQSGLKRQLLNATFGLQENNGFYRWNDDMEVRRWHLQVEVAATAYHPYKVLESLFEPGKIITSNYIYGYYDFDRARQALELEWLYSAAGCNIAGNAGLTLLFLTLLARAMTREGRERSKSKRARPPTQC